MGIGELCLGLELEELLGLKAQEPPFQQSMDMSLTNHFQKNLGGNGNYGRVLS